MLIAVCKIFDERVLIAAEGIIQGYLGRKHDDPRLKYAEARSPPHYPVPAVSNDGLFYECPLQRAGWELYPCPFFNRVAIICANHSCDFHA